MKTQKFRIEKKILQELSTGLNSINYRLRVLASFLLEKSINDSHNFGVINIYYNLVLNYLHEVEALIEMPGTSVIVSKELMDKLNNYKKAINKTEQEISNIPFISLSIH